MESHYEQDMLKMTGIDISLFISGIRNQLGSTQYSDSRYDCCPLVNRYFWRLVAQMEMMRAGYVNYGN